MVRGGFFAMTAAADRLFSVTGERKVAEARLGEAMTRGLIKCRGRPKFYVARPKHDAAGKMILYDLSQSTPSRLGELTDIPLAFLQGIRGSEATGINWLAGCISNLNERAEPYIYAEVILREKDVNNLKKIMGSTYFSETAQTKSRKKKRKDSTWETWVAAVATLAQEGALSPTMKSKELTSLVTARLQTWDIEEKEGSTVAPTVREILLRIRHLPPPEIS